MARNVRDTALMLSVIAGSDDQSPISFPVDTSLFTLATDHPEIDGFRVAWSQDLGIIPADPEVGEIAAAAARRFTELGCIVEEAHPDFSGTREVIQASRGFRMVSLHADKLPNWRDKMNSNLVWNIEQGLRLTVEEIGMAEKERTAIYHRARQFFERYDLLLTPTVAVPPFPVEIPYPTEINGEPMTSYTDWFLLTYAITLTGLPAISIPCGWTSQDFQWVSRLWPEAGRTNRSSGCCCI